MSLSVPLPLNKQERILALHALNILDTPPEERFDRIARLAKYLFRVPIVLVSFIDTNRQWFKSCYGLMDRETPRERSFCAYTLLNSAPLVVPDAHKDRRFADNPLVDLEPHIRFYAGYPLKDPRGYILGTLCVLDRVPHQFQQQELDLLYDLAQMVEREINLTHTQATISPQWKQSHRSRALFDDATISMMLLNAI